MRIAINLLYMIPGIVGGTERYATELLHGLARLDPDNEYLVFTNRESASWPIPQCRNFRRVSCPLSASRRTFRYLFEQLGLPILLRHHSADVVHSLGYVSPLLAPCRSMVTIHDLNYRAFGSEMSQRRRVALGFFVRQSALRASRVITGSEFSRRELEREIGLPPDRIVVIPYASKVSSDSGPASVSELEQLGITTPYVLAFSSLSPNKNIPRLLQAYDVAKRRYKLPHQLVLVGHKQQQEPGSGFIQNGNGVIFTGYLDEPLLQLVLRNAQLLVFPSLYEGFGIPVLEAMSARVPVVSSSSASLPEVAGDAAIYFDPRSVDDMAKKIADVALDPSLREALIEKGTLNLRRFSWDRTARETLAAYQLVTS